LRLKAVAALCCAGAVFYFAMLQASATAAELQPWSGGAQPIFSLPTATGANVALEAARGHVVLVHFFATWCESCREELPALNRLAARAGGNATVLAIAVADADRSVQRFFAAAPVDFPILLDRDRVVAKAWNIATLPTTFVLDGSLQPTFSKPISPGTPSIPASSRPRRARAAPRRSKMPATASLGGRPCTDANFSKPA
jgi:thiol-disulfide isomerase/thioredoxin